ncbi:O-antigen ligase family protein [Neptuniibacter pectenicola]|jgi:O-antigen ligase|uniref:O-antigen ligase family protein n=1 Tax=Neptuniibacter pectenicola TaxID=1806669 RepID=A0ABU9TMI7_9GAMM
MINKVDVYSDKKNHKDQVDYIVVFLILLFLAGAGMFGFYSTLMFLIVGGIYTGLNFKYALATYKNNWFMFLFGLISVFSVFWAEAPLAALRNGVQFLLTIGIFLTVIYCVKLNILFKAISAAMLAVMVLNVTSSQTVEISYTGEVVKVGYFGSKNSMAMVAGFALLSSIGAVLCSKASLLSRFLAVTCIVISLATFLQARSLGSTISLGFVLAISGLLFFYSRANLLTETKVNINFLVFIFIFIFIFVFIVFFDYSVYESFMYSLGKDPTITGRTDIWGIGFESIKENPILGVGQSSYWNINNIGALEIWELMHKEEGSPFGFHNLYIHTYVELGLLGFLTVLLFFIKGFLGINKCSLKGMRYIDIVLVSLFLIIFSKTFFETVGFSPFSLSTFFLCFSVVHIRRFSFYDKPAYIKLRLN